MRHAVISYFQHLNKLTLITNYILLFTIGEKLSKRGNVKHNIINLRNRLVHSRNGFKSNDL